MQKTVSDERFKEFLRVSTKYFSWDIILEEAGIGNVSDKGDQYEITCPFHDDKRPSMRLNKLTGVYHCFSCDRKGTYTKFLWELNGKSTTYSQFCEQVLQAHPAMQEELRFQSLFVTQDTLAPEFNKRRVFDRTSIASKELPLTVLVSKARELSDDWETMVLSLTLLQQGVSTSNVYALLKKQHIAVNDSGPRVNLMDII